MKSRFNSLDVVCGITELQRLKGWRVNQIYDVDNKTYLFRFHRAEEKVLLLMESGIRFHTTQFDWAKNLFPSGFTMKLRKHLKNKRLENVKQVGVDRIVDFEFGSGEASYHIFLELYDRGNIVLTDHQIRILHILRPHSEGEKNRFAVHENYPLLQANHGLKFSEDNWKSIFNNESSEGSLRRFLMTYLDCGPAVIDHVLFKYKLDNIYIKHPLGSGTDSNKDNTEQKKNRVFQLDEHFSSFMLAVNEANEILEKSRHFVGKGYILQKKEERPTEKKNENDVFYHNIEYHPYYFDHFDKKIVAIYDTFMIAVDEFYSNVEEQKIDVKVIQQEREAMKKLNNVKFDHAKRLEQLDEVQKEDKLKAELITSNQSLVDNAILAIRSALANHMTWQDVKDLVKVAQSNGDKVAYAIKDIKLEVNCITLRLTDPFNNTYESEVEEDKLKKSAKNTEVIVDIDLSLSAWANARKYYDQKRSAAQKEKKTVDASQKALKSAEKKTQQLLKDVRAISTISKSRKLYWFEKFYWFISSENYLVIGGRDAQQNELIVKRYMRAYDVYVHAEIQGASSVLIRNFNSSEIPPKTLLEAGTMAICYSVAWDAKVVTNVYWVHNHQVSKTAPSGEYLPTGSFMIRGKKNFLPPCNLIMGVSVLFKLEESFMKNHIGERKVRNFGDNNYEDIHYLETESTNLERVETMPQVKPKDDALKYNIQCDEENSNNGSGIIEEENGKHFPDTQVKVEHESSSNIISKSSAKLSLVETNVNQITNCDLKPDETIIISAAPSKKKQISNKKKTKETKMKIQQQNTNVTNDFNCVDKNSTLKRGQKKKMKKMRSKYKNQDEEERDLRMQLLKSSGVKNDKTDLNLNKLNISEKTDVTSAKKNVIETKQYEDRDDGDLIALDADMTLLDALTGQPFDDDELLFALPVVAPYQALQNYKFKVKLTPGTTKRGRATKTVLTMFNNDKSCGVRIKNLMKEVKEETLARNMPGKVKLSAQQLHKLKKS